MPIKIDKKYLAAVLLFIITFLVYLISSRGEGANWNYFVVLADAFLHGRLYLLENPPWLNELVFWRGYYFVVFPPMPAFLLVPFVAVFGKTFYQPFLSIMLGAASVALAYMVFMRLFKKKSLALWMGILYAFGTIQWYHAAVGSAWYIAHIVALFFLWLMILESITKQRLFLIGLFIGAAYLSRIPTVLSIIFVLVFLQKKLFDFENKRIKIFPKSIVLLMLGVLPAIALNFSYNYLRYGVISDIGYVLLPIFNEPWYRYGFVNIKYIPIHLKEMFTAMPQFSSKPPFIVPNLFAMAIWLITPAYFLALFAKFKQRIYLASLAAVIAIAIPDLIHGGNGFTQFGYRHTLDFLPFLLILIAAGLNNKFNRWWSLLLILLSILVNLWGVVMISFFNIWTM